MGARRGSGAAWARPGRGLGAAGRGRARPRGTETAHDDGSSDAAVGFGAGSRSACAVRPPLCLEGQHLLRRMLRQVSSTFQFAGSAWKRHSEKRAESGLKAAESD